MFDFKAIPKEIQAAMADSGFRVKAESDDELAQLLVMDDIGDYGISAQDVSGFLGENRGKPVDVKINSFGGDAYAGLAIYNDLTSHDALVTTTVTGVAYSAASVIFMAGEERRMHEQSHLGIHRALTGAVGNQNVMLAVAEWLGKLDDALIDIYDAPTRAGAEQINTWLDGIDGMLGTQFSAAEAKEAGFADTVIMAKGKQEPEDSQVRACVRAKMKRQLAMIAQRRRA